MMRLFLLLLSALPLVCSAWTSPRITLKPHVSSSVICRVADTTVQSDVPASVESEGVEKEEDDGDWEYVEYENLSEADVVGSEWLVGTNWDNKPNKIDETWVRLVTAEDGKNKAYWGDNSEGTWSLDTASQYLSISKNFLWGKTIWAGISEDYYYQQGIVRGWNYWSPAAVYGQWQARRLNVEPEEAGIAPWFQENDESESDDEDSDEKEEA